MTRHDLDRVVDRHPLHTRPDQAVSGMPGQPAAGALRTRDLAWLRHAESGELAEHTPRVHLLDGNEVAEAVPTHRGTGNTW